MKHRYQALTMLMGLSLCGFALGEDRPAVPQGVRLSLEVEKREWFLGENILVHLVVENIGQKSFTIELGGDYRGASRHTRFKVDAFDEKGQSVPDPDPCPMCMGGLGGAYEIKPGTRHYETLPLMRYRRFEKPGTYRLRVSHDFGWHAPDPSKFPAAEGTITVRMPGEEEARKVLGEMYSLPRPDGGAFGKKKAPYSDFSTLIYPPYLPFLVKAAADRDEGALEALAHTPTPAATRELVRLLGHRDAAFAMKALEKLQHRLPDPRLAREPAPPRPEDDYRYRQRYLIKHSWRDEFAAEVRRAGRALVEKENLEGLERGAYILECVGQSEDLPRIIKALDRAVPRALKGALEQRDYPYPQAGATELLRAAQMLCERGALVPERPATPGELVVFTSAVGNRESFRPIAWQGVFARALTHEMPLVRVMALSKVPIPVPEVVQKQLPALLKDTDIAVRIAACGLAGRGKLVELRKTVLETLATATHHHLFGAASEVALLLGAHAERVQILIDRLDEPGMTARCLSALVGTVVADLNGYGHSTEIDVGQGRACKKEWQLFAKKHEKALARGERLKMAEFGETLGRLFPTFNFSPPAPQ